MSNERFANFQVAAYALYLTGGATQRIDTEDVAVTCWNIARSRFGWKKYPDFPDKDIVRFALADAKKVKYGRLVDGTGGDGWILTPRGLQWIKQNETALQVFQSGPTRSAVTFPKDASLQRTRAHSIFHSWRDGVAETPRLYDVADLVQLTADAPTATVLQSLGELENAAILAGDVEIKEFIEWLRTGIKHSRA